MEPLVLDPESTAEALQVSVPYVRKMIANRELPVIHLGRCVRVPTLELKEWIDAKVREAGI